MIDSMRLWATLVLLSLLTVSTSVAASKPDQKLYEKAVVAEEQLLSSDVQSAKITNWKKTVAAFQKIYYTYPTSGYCDNALFRVASLYVRMGEKFSDPLYLRRAHSTYQFLIDQYPSSSLRKQAKTEYNKLSEQLGKEIAKPIENAPPVTSSDRKGTSAALKTIRHFPGKDYSRIVIDFDQEVIFKRNRLPNPDRLYFDFDNTIAPRPLLRQKTIVNDGLLKEIRVGQYTERKTRIVLELGNAGKYDAYPLYNPYRLVIDIQAANAASPPPLFSETPEMPPAMAKANTGGNYSLARQLGLKVRTIMVDPGHGGHDPGAMAGKLREKDITLDVSLRLKKILEEKYAFEVLLTREEDFYVPLEQRIALANSKGVDLFVSVHVNSSRNTQAKGVETYYLNFATTPEAMEVAARENAVAEKKMAELQKLTTAIALNSKIAESRDFATQMQARLVEHLQKDYSTNSLGVKQAPFYVLIGAQMPAVLAEISFLSNKVEKTLLTRPLYRQSVAEGLARGVTGYIETLAEGKITHRLK